MADPFLKLKANDAETRAFAFICRKCGKTADELRSGLKKRAKAELPKKTLRVVLTDCQGVCPKRGASVNLVAPGATSVFTVVTIDDVDEFVAHVIGALK